MDLKLHQMLGDMVWEPMLKIQLKRIMRKRLQSPSAEVPKCHIGIGLCTFSSKAVSATKHRLVEY